MQKCQVPDDGAAIALTIHSEWGDLSVPFAPEQRMRDVREYLSDVPFAELNDVVFCDVKDFDFLHYETEDASSVNTYVTEHGFVAAIGDRTVIAVTPEPMRHRFRSLSASFPPSARICTAESSA
jgi:hypothetical protein